MNKRPSTSSTARLMDVLVHDADEQRRRLARTIHDGPAQLVSAAAMNLELMERGAGRLGQTAASALANARQQLVECASELSRLSHEQDPPFLGEGGLLNAAVTLARRSGQRLDLHVQASVPMAALGRAVELASYRLLEAGLGGLFAEGVPVAARLERDDKQLSLTLSGRPATGASAAVRLLACEHRARLGGGRLVVSRSTHRKSGRVLRLVVRFPVPRNQAKQPARQPTRKNAKSKKSGGP